ASEDASARLAARTARIAASAPTADRDVAAGDMTTGRPLRGGGPAWYVRPLCAASGSRQLATHGLGAGEPDAAAVGARAGDRDGAALHRAALTQTRGCTVAAAAAHQLLQPPHPLPLPGALRAVGGVAPHAPDHLLGEFAIERLLQPVAHVPSSRHRGTGARGQIVLVHRSSSRSIDPVAVSAASSSSAAPARRNPLR